MRKQMASRSAEMVHSSTSQATWRSIDWTKARREVRRLQMRIAKAVKMYQIIRVSSIGIKRYRKIKADANPYLPEYGLYFWQRRHFKDAKLLPALSARQMRLAF